MKRQNDLGILWSQEPLLTHIICLFVNENLKIIMKQFFHGLKGVKNFWI